MEANVFAGKLDQQQRDRQRLEEVYREIQREIEREGVPEYSKCLQRRRANWRQRRATQAPATSDIRTTCEVSDGVAQQLAETQRAYEQGSEGKQREGSTVRANSEAIVCL